MYAQKIDEAGAPRKTGSKSLVKSVARTHGMTIQLTTPPASQ
jgi:hypothetical protein